MTFSTSFQLTASQGGWPKKPEHTRKNFAISTHSLTRRLTRTALFKAVGSQFQLTASQGGWRSLTLFFSASVLFQLTASQGGWLIQLLPDTAVLVFQLTASQGGWQMRNRIHIWSSAISTHSLTRRLTLSIIFFFRFVTISTHSLTRRLTVSGCIHFWRSMNFNSQPHKEADQNATSAPIITRQISTHSLTRRLTQNSWIDDRQQVHFNSQPHKEADHLRQSQQNLHRHFNSQPHKEADYSNPIF